MRSQLKGVIGAAQGHRWISRYISLSKSQGRHSLGRTGLV
jgi:hypothetical protein